MKGTYDYRSCESLFGYAASAHIRSGGICQLCGCGDGNCLQTLNPVLAKEWHPEKNGNLSPRNVTVYSNKKVWWLCNRGHEWEAIVGSRMRGRGCPYCLNKAVCGDNCLSTTNPSLAKEWHPTKNNNLTPEDVTPGSGKNIWWQCNKGHEWEAIVYSRNKGHGCPYCSGQKVCKDNCLQTINPELDKEWHPIRNKDLTPRDVAPGSNKAVWWQCSKGHEWKAIIAGRSKGTRCPVCVRRRRKSRKP